MGEAAVSGPDARRGPRLILAGLWLLGAVPGAWWPGGVPAAGHDEAPVS